jgi:ATP-dependent DNA helicase RecG
MSEKMSEKILWSIKDNPKISAKELAYIVNCSSRTIERTIAKLKKEGRIKRMGTDKGGHWGDKMKSENANNTTINHKNIPKGWKKVKSNE